MLVNTIVSFSQQKMYTGTLSRKRFYNSGSMIDSVIIGDAGDKLTYESLNTAFRYVMSGADLIALEKDRYWMTPGGLSLSAGPFVQALEFATGKMATIVGKPSKTFFERALSDMDFGLIRQL